MIKGLENRCSQEIHPVNLIDGKEISSIGEKVLDFWLGHLNLG